MSPPGPSARRQQQQRQIWKQQQQQEQLQHRYPQPNYPPSIYGSLLHALRRRNTHASFLPSVADQINQIPKTYGRYQSLDSYEDIYDGIKQLSTALKGETRRTALDEANSNAYNPNDVPGTSGYRPPLPPILRVKIEHTLSAIEVEAVQLGKDIEMNHFRVRRGDPRGKPDQELFDMREKCRMAWALAISECVRDVELCQTGLKGKALREEETKLQARNSNRETVRGSWWQGYGGKL